MAGNLTSVMRSVPLCVRLRTYPPARKHYLPTVASGKRAEADIYNSNRDKIMLETIAIVLVILWLLGMVSATTLGGFVHVLLVIAVVIILIRVIRGRKPF